MFLSLLTDVLVPLKVTEVSCKIKDRDVKNSTKFIAVNHAKELHETCLTFPMNRKNFETPWRLMQSFCVFFSNEPYDFSLESC